MYDVYSDLRDSHIVWGDVASRNLGFVDGNVVIPDGLFGRLKKELEMKFYKWIAGAYASVIAVVIGLIVELIKQ